MKKLSFFLASAILLTFVIPTSSFTAERLPKEQYKSGSEIKKLLGSVIKTARQWTVKVQVEDKVRAMGTIVGADGWILTKASQIQSPVTCVLPDGKSYQAEIKGIHEVHDLALLKIKADKLSVVDWIKDRDGLKVGHWMITPSSEELPLSVGVMSVQPRSIPKSRGILGISIEETKEGVQVSRVYPHSGADQAGMQEGDLVLQLLGKPVTAADQLIDEVRKYQPGDLLLLRIRRGLQEVDCLATLKAPVLAAFSRGAMQNQMGGSLSLRRTGFQNVIQHDSVLRPEECGGPVLDLNGKAIGINIARAGRTETYALPFYVIPHILQEMKSGKHTPPQIVKRWQAIPPPPPLPEG